MPRSLLPDDDLRTIQAVPPVAWDTKIVSRFRFLGNDLYLYSPRNFSEKSKHSTRRTGYMDIIIIMIMHWRRAASLVLFVCLGVVYHEPIPNILGLLWDSSTLFRVQLYFSSFGFLLINTVACFFLSFCFSVNVDAATD